MSQWFADLGPLAEPLERVLGEYKGRPEEQDAYFRGVINTAFGRPQDIRRETQRWLKDIEPRGMEQLYSTLEGTVNSALAGAATDPDMDEAFRRHYGAGERGFYFLVQENPLSDEPVAPRVYAIGTAKFLTRIELRNRKAGFISRHGIKPEQVVASGNLIAWPRIVYDGNWLDIEKQPAVVAFRDKSTNTIPNKVVRKVLEYLTEANPTPYRDHFGASIIATPELLIPIHAKLEEIYASRRFGPHEIAEMKSSKRKDGFSLPFEKGAAGLRERERLADKIDKAHTSSASGMVDDVRVHRLAYAKANLRLTNAPLVWAELQEMTPQGKLMHLKDHPEFEIVRHSVEIDEPLELLRDLGQEREQSLIQLATNIKYALVPHAERKEWQARLRNPLPDLSWL